MMSGPYPLLLLLGMVAMPSASAGNAACPSVSASQTEYVRQFFASELTVSFRQEHGLLGVTPASVRALIDPQDADACQRMARAAPLHQSGRYPKVWRGFRAGTFYVMHVTREIPPGAFQHEGGTGLVVLDANMNVIAIAS